MNRLAETVIELINELHTERLNHESEYLPLIEAANRLAAYEDSGLEPEEAQQLVNKQKWHVVADGDLPPKLKDGERAKSYFATQQHGRNDPRKETTIVFWNGEIFSNEKSCLVRAYGVLAWRELPEPWEGERNE